MNESTRPDRLKLQAKFAQYDASGQLVSNGVPEAKKVIEDAGGMVEQVFGVVHFRGKLTPEVIEAIQFLCDTWGYQQSKMSTKI